MQAEISYDIVMNGEVEFVEGTFRLSGGDWQVMVFSTSDHSVTEPEVARQKWESGVAGVFVKYPRHTRLDQRAVERVLSGALGVSEWVRVQGPDSMRLR